MKDIQLTECGPAVVCVCRCVCLCLNRYELGILLEILAPTCAHVFLLVASFANACKSISYMSRLPPRAAILKSFAVRENVGDVSAKANSQDVLSGLFGLLLGIQASFFIGESVWKSLAVFAVSASIVAVSSLKALSGLRLNTLNRHRLEIILDSFVRGRRIPGPREVNQGEGTLASWSKCLSRADFTVVFGASARHVRKGSGGGGGSGGRDGDLLSLIACHRQEAFLVRAVPSRNRKKLECFIFVQPDISAESLLLALLQAHHLKNRFVSLKAKGKQETFDAAPETKAALAAARAALPALREGLASEGWATKHILWMPKNLLHFQPPSGSRQAEDEAKRLEMKAQEQGQEREGGEGTSSTSEASTGGNGAGGNGSVLLQNEAPRDPTCNSPVCEMPTIVEVAETEEEP